jgi:hypothetical protein
VQENPNSTGSWARRTRPILHALHRCPSGNSSSAIGPSIRGTRCLTGVIG